MDLSLVLILLTVILFFVQKYCFKKANYPSAKGKTAIVTGAAGSIGKATTLRLLSNGWKVIACDVNEEGLNGLAREVALLPSISQHDLLTKTLDMASKPSRDKFYTFVGEYSKNASLDAIINIAGIMNAQPQATLNEDQLSQIFEINALGPMKLINNLTPLLLKNENGGNITLVTSMNARTTFLNIGAYPATKHALAGFGDTMRREAKQSKLPLRVSMIEPGSVVTPIAMNLITRQLEWCKAFPESRWVQGILKSASSAFNLQQKGLKVEWVSITPEAVADLVLESVSVEKPSSRYVKAAFPLTIIFYLMLFLPSELGDMLIGAL